MATIIAPGCFDLVHEGHQQFLDKARHLSGDLKWHSIVPANRLIVAVNTDEYARKLKVPKWGEKYPILPITARMEALAPYAHEIVSFDSEDRLHEIIEWLAPCIIVKGPDYAGKRVTGDDIAPVLILDTPEPESVKKMKREVYSAAAQSTQ